MLSLGFSLHSENLTHNGLWDYNEAKNMYVDEALKVTCKDEISSFDAIEE